MGCQIWAHNIQLFTNMPLNIRFWVTKTSETCFHFLSSSLIFLSDRITKTGSPNMSNESKQNVFCGSQSILDDEWWKQDHITQNCMHPNNLSVIFLLFSLKFTNSRTEEVFSYFSICLAAFIRFFFFLFHFKLHRSLYTAPWLWWSLVYVYIVSFFLFSFLFNKLRFYHVYVYIYIYIKDEIAWKSHQSYLPLHL